MCFGVTSPLIPTIAIITLRHVNEQNVLFGYFSLIFRGELVSMVPPPCHTSWPPFLCSFYRQWHFGWKHEEECLLFFVAGCRNIFFSILILSMCFFFLSPCCWLSIYICMVMYVYFLFFFFVLSAHRVWVWYVSPGTNYFVHMTRTVTRTVLSS